MPALPRNPQGAIASTIVQVCRRSTRARSRERMAQLSMESVAERVLYVYRGAIQGV